MDALLNNPRDAAVLALRDRQGNVSSHLERVLASVRLSGPDAALARDLALGAVRRRATIQAVLSAFLADPSRRLPGVLNEILHVALYQVLFLDRVPAFAAVNEAVEQAGRFRHRRQSGLVNGVLRTIARSVSPVQTGPVPATREAIPVGAGCFRLAGRAVFPDPAVGPAEWLAAAHSLPQVLARRWIERLGLEAAIQVATHANARPPLILRVNPRLASVEGVVSDLMAAGVLAQPHANGHSVVVTDWCDIRKLAVFRRGAVQPQDPSATDVVLAAEAREGMNVLDLCASPGVKTTHLAEVMGNAGSITAVDVSQAKLQRIQENCQRMGVTIVKMMLAEEIGRLTPRSFDVVLADVPCSNTGVLARRAEARWRFDDRGLAALVRDQKALVRIGAEFIRPGGRLVYSTCSIEPEEDSQVAQSLLKAEPRMSLRADRLTLPAGADDPRQWYDGGYRAVLEAS